MIKQIFIWWERQTIGTLIKTLFLENLWARISTEINIIKIKKIKGG